MFNFEEHVEDLQSHIVRVQANCKTLALKMAANGHREFARVLLANASVHDASKWHGIEWEVMHMGPDVDANGMTVIDVGESEEVFVSAGAYAVRL